jgi:hypothetical protein
LYVPVCAAGGARARVVKRGRGARRRRAARGARRAEPVVARRGGAGRAPARPREPPLTRSEPQRAGSKF